MIVYVESNFVLETALLQEEEGACAGIIALAESRTIRLAIPGFSLVEPYITIEGRARTREQLHSELAKQFGQMARSAPYTDLVRRSAEVTQLLVSSRQEERDRLDAAVRRIHAAAEVVSLAGSGHAEALALTQTRSLSPTDAVVYASVLQHARAEQATQKCFLNRNFKDFLTPDIQADLDALNCKLLPDFVNGERFIESRTRK